MNVSSDVCDRVQLSQETDPKSGNFTDTESNDLSHSASSKASNNKSLVRRSLFTGGAIAALLGHALSPASAEGGGSGQPSSPGANTGAPPSPIPGSYHPTADWKSPELRLVRRITLGLTPDEADIALDIGYNDYLERQLNPGAIDDSSADAFIAANFKTLTMSPPDLHAIDSVQGMGGTVERELISAAIYRATLYI